MSMFVENIYNYFHKHVYVIEKVFLFEKHVPKHLFNCNCKTFLSL